MKTSIAAELEKIFLTSTAKSDQIESIKKDASKYLTEEPTDDEVKVLIKTDEESRADYTYRVIGFYQEKKDVLNLTAIS